MATIDDVAKMARVSVATVSRVINKTGTVREATTKRVQAAIDALAYTPNLSARNLRRNESRIIMMLAPNFTNPYYSKILAGICDTSRELGYIPLVYSTYDTLTLNRDGFLNLIETNQVDGTITLACNFDDSWMSELSETHAIVQCSEYVQGSRAPHISVDNFTAAYETVRYLIGLGHRRIGFMGSRNQFYSTKMRYKGYCTALEDAGIPVNPEYVVMGSIDYSFQSGKEAAAGLLAQKKRPTAVFCISDVLALGVIAQAKDMEIDVPKQLSVTGFDDVDYTTMFHPYLSTMSIPCYELGRQGMLLLQQHMQRNADANIGVFLPHKFIERESCAPCEEAD